MRLVAVGTGLQALPHGMGERPQALCADPGMALIADLRLFGLDDDRVFFHVDPVAVHAGDILALMSAAGPVRVTPFQVSMAAQTDLRCFSRRQESIWTKRWHRWLFLPATQARRMVATGAMAGLALHLREG